MQHVMQWSCPRPLYPLFLSGGENWEKKETKKPTKVGAVGGTSYNIVKNVADVFLFSLFVGREGGLSCDYILQGTLPCTVKYKNVLLISKGRDLEV